MRNDEISVSDIIYPLFRNKKVFLIAIASSLIISLLLNFVILKKSYDATSYVLMTGKQTEEKFDIKPFVEQIKSNYTFARMLSDLQLNGGGYSAGALNKNIAVKPLNHSVAIHVSGTNQKEITKIANYLALFAGANIEVATRQAMVIEFKNDLLKTENLINVVKSELEQSRKSLQETPEKLLTKKSLATDSYLYAVTKESSGGSAKDTGALALFNEDINPVYTNLKNIIAEKSAELSKYEAERLNSLARIDEMQKEINSLQSNNFLENLNDDSNKMQGINGFASILVTPAVEPVEPTGPNIVLISAFLLFLSIVFSVLFIYAKTYWKVKRSEL